MQVVRFSLLLLRKMPWTCICYLKLPTIHGKILAQLPAVPIVQIGSHRNASSYTLGPETTVESGERLECFSINIAICAPH